MSLIFGGGQKSKPQYSSLQVQTSASNMAVTIAGGLCRLSPNLIWFGDFASHKQKQGGKGGGGKGGGTYTYSCAVAMALCQGVSTGIQRVFRDNEKNSNLTKLNLVFFDGQETQTPWSYLTTNHPTEALSYPGLVYVASPKYDLGQSAALPQHSFETEALLYDTAPGGLDADVALFTELFLTAPIWGAGFPSTDIDITTLLSTPAAPTTGDNAWQTYCTAMGFGMSPAMSGQETANDVLDRWSKIFNCAVVWNGQYLKFVPYSLEAISGNGVNFVPVTASAYTLTDADFISAGVDPVIGNVRDFSKVKNKLQVEILSRAKEYNAVPIEWVDQGLVDQFGELPDSVFTAHEVCDPTMATTIASLMGQRNAFRGSTKFRLKLPVSYSLLEPMDLLTFTDPQMGTIQVQVDHISEEDEESDELTLDCSMVRLGSTDSVGFTPPDQSAGGNDTGVSPGPVNPPIIFEPPSSLSSGVPQVWAAVSGGNGTTFGPYWGGCFVWVSLGGGTYTQIGEITQPARMGKTTSALVSYGGANPDTIHTVGVDLTMSGGELIDVSSADAANAVTLSLLRDVGGGLEFLSYETALLTSTYHYTLGTELYRGLYGSTPGAHLSGIDYARLDTDIIFQYTLPPQYIGQTLSFKFQSYNIYGGGLEDISTVTAYTYTPTGAGYGTGSGGLPATPTGVAGSAGAGFARVTWNANSVNDNVTQYEIWRATGASQPFGSATRIGATPGTEYVDTSGAAAQVYTYFVVAVNALGSSSPSTSVNLTATLASKTFGFSFQRSLSAITVSTAFAFFDTPIAWSLPAGLADCQGTITNDGSTAAVAPSAQTDFDIQSPPGTSIGTMRFAASSLTATFIKASLTAIPLGQMTQIVAPANLNGMTGMLVGSLKGFT